MRDKLTRAIIPQTIFQLAFVIAGTLGGFAANTLRHHRVGSLYEARYVRVSKDLTFATSPTPASSGPEAPRTFIDTTLVPPTGRTITVAAGGDFQAALNRAQPGDVVALQAGTTFTGNFVLPKKSGAGWIVIRTSAPDSSLPAPGTRITPSYASVLPKTVSPNSSPAIAWADGAHHYRFVGIEITVSESVMLNYGVVILGEDKTSLAQLPSDIIFDRVYIHGNAEGNIKRGISLNGVRVAIIDSYLSDFHFVGVEAQAIAGWNGPGPYKIVNNYLEASAENVIFGGAAPGIANLVPSDIEIRRNYFFKPLSWKRGHPSYAGKHWLVKNLFELKNARRVLVEANILENNWVDGQVGIAVLFTPRNSGGTAPWSTVEDVTFTHNILRHASGGISIYGADASGASPSQPAQRILIKNNLFEDIDGTKWGGDGRFLQIVSIAGHGDPHDITVDHNTAFQSGNIISAGERGAKIMGFVYQNNITPHNSYGVIGTGIGPGDETLNSYFPGCLFKRNVIAGLPRSVSPSIYPPNNFFPASLHAVGFVNLAEGNYRLAPSSRYRDAGTDRKDIGADIAALVAATAGVK